jgi:hypothetical protein
MGRSVRELPRHTTLAKGLAELHRELRPSTCAWRCYFRAWLNTYFGGTVPFRKVWRFLPWALRIARRAGEVRTLPFHQQLVISWISTVFREFAESERKRQQSADQYQAAIQAIRSARTALEHARRETCLWQGVNEQIRSSSDLLDHARQTLIHEAGGAAPLLTRTMSQLSSARLDIFDRALFRVFVEAAGMSKRRAYEVVAVVHG